MNDKTLESMTTEGDRTGQMFVYEDNDGATKCCMVGYDVLQKEYDLMPEYLQEHFERVTDKHDELLLTQAPNVYVLPEDVVKQIEEIQIEQTKSDS